MPLRRSADFENVQTLVADADVVEDLNHLTGETALRKLRRSLHEQHDVVRLHFVVDELLNAHICFLLQTAHMGPIGNLVGALWFFMLFLAAITSSISMYQPSLAFFEETLGWTRRNATTLMVAICVFASFLVMYYSKGSIFWATIDDWVGTFLIFVLAMVQIICFSWVFGIERGWKEAHEGASIRIPFFYKFVMKYVAPGYLLIVFIAFAVTNLPAWIKNVADEPLRQGALALVAAVTVLMVVCTYIGEKRWRAAGMDVDGDRPPADEEGNG